MDKRYKDKGLVVIGDEVQGSDKDAIEEVAKDNRVEFTITKGTTRPAGMAGIPHAIIFDAAGKLVFAGHPMDDEFDRTVKKALRDVDLDESDDDSGLPSAPKPVIESRTWTNEDGKTITASILEINGESVKFKLSNGKTVDYEISKLSEADQEVIKNAGEESADE